MLMVFTGGTAAQDFQAMRLAFRGLLGEIEVASCDDLQAYAAL